MPKIVFLHPDLGIGGAEKAVIDAALALKSRGHSVEFVTAHHDPSHCFTETKDGTLKVTVAGDWLPRNIFGVCYALCAYLRMIYAATYLVLFSGLKPDLVFCDQISACLPILRLSRTKVIFYCHYPDLLLTERACLCKRLYRAPLDFMEEWTTGMADCLLVNSAYTGTVFKETFKTLSRCSPKVIYPIPNFKALEQQIEKPAEDLMPSNKKTIFLSINRYERKKNVALAIQAFGQLKDRLSKSAGDSIHLVVAGGYDNRVDENVEYFTELCRLSIRLGVSADVTFLRSFSDTEKRTLLQYSTCLLYTPEREHFGIVPIEAMYMQCPVIACRSGGPLETVVDGKTGFLRDGRPDQFAEAMTQIVEDPKLSKKLGENGKKHVLEKFSFENFTNQLEDIVRSLS